MRSKVEQSFLARFPLTVIPNGIDPEVFHPTSKQQARLRLGLPQNSRILAFTAHGGLNNPWKGGQILINALKYLASRHPSILLLNIGGDYTNRDLPMASIPYVTNPATLATIYAAADVFAYPTLADSFGLVVLEALACGLPVVSFATGGVPEIVQDGVNGFLVQPNDQEQFNVALDMMLKKNALREAMSKSAANIPEHFTAQRMTESYRSVYNVAKETFAIQGPPRPDTAIASRLSKQLASVGNRVGVKAYRRMFTSL
jgi:glycosyltransferase involved in cell wall biosynthesis